MVKIFNITYKRYKRGISPVEVNLTHLLLSILAQKDQPKAIPEESNSATTKPEGMCQ